MSETTTIYGSSLSSNTKRVTVCAYELGLAAELVELDFSKGEHKTPDYMKLNPMGKMPAMVDDDGFALWESSAMAWYLAERNPSKGLLPLDMKGRADQLRWMFWNACHVEPAMGALAFERWIKPHLMKQETDEERCAEKLQELERFLPILNAQLEGRDWLGGKACSVADVCLGVTLEVAERINVDLSAYRHIGSWLSRLQARPSWKKASAAVAEST
jgi:glutathione S-transferase